MLFRSLQARGAKGVADAWRTSIVTALEDKASKESPLEHKLVKFLLSDFVTELAELDAKKTELETQLKATAPAKGEDGEETESEEAESDEETARKVVYHTEKMGKSLSKIILRGDSLYILSGDGLYVKDLKQETMGYLYPSIRETHRAGSSFLIDSKDYIWIAPNCDEIMDKKSKESYRTNKIPKNIRAYIFSKNIDLKKLMF